MHPTPLVSIVIPMHGRSKYIEAAVESATNQTHPNIEIILVDDNGDGSEEQKNTYGKVSHLLNSHVRYLKNEHNSGVSYSRNKGVSNAHGEYITFLDDDDIYYPEKIKTQLEMMQSHRWDLSICSFDRFDDDGLSSPPSAIQPELTTARDLLTKKSSPHAPTIMIKKEIFELSGGFPVELAYREDVTLVVRALTHGASIGTIPTPLFNYRVHTGFRLSKKRFHCKELHDIYRIVNHERSTLLETLSSSDRQSIQLRHDYKHLNTLYKNGCLIPWQLFRNVATLSLKNQRPTPLAKSAFKFIVSRLRRHSSV
ncbi:glycosyltransferase family 2 protein [Halomonas sp. V046]|uniref:glycosyltransferase family 2 protein n=1 Tax=Halomonas sp. V046 TaxID=3459611 RepID=UPI004044FA87